MNVKTPKGSPGVWKGLWPSLMLLCGQVLCGAYAVAMEWTVTTGEDGPDIVAGDGLCADAEARCTLRAAIQEANALPGPDRIIIPASVGAVRLSLPGAGEDLAATGDLDITDDLNVIGAGAVTTVIDASDLDRVIHVWDPLGDGVAVVLEELALTGGFVHTVGDDVGAGLLVGLQEEDESAGGHGGGPSGGQKGQGCEDEGEEGALPQVKLVHCDIYGNVAYRTLPEPVEIIKPNGKVELKTRSGSGGGIANTGELLLENSRVRHNEAAEGGGGIVSGGSLTLIASQVIENRAYGNGGGLKLEGNAASILDRCWVYGNGAVSAGGLFLAGMPNRLKVSNSFVQDNWAEDKTGGINVTCATVELLNVTVSDNVTCGAFAGGISNGGNLTLVHVTLTENRVDPQDSRCGTIKPPEADAEPGTDHEGEDAAHQRTGGLWIGSGQKMVNTLVINSLLAENHPANCGAGPATGNMTLHSTLDDDGSCLNLPDYNVGQGSWHGPAGLEGAHRLPLMGERVYMPASASGAVDAGDPEATAAFGLTVDALGLPRLYDGDGDGVAMPDLGAVEQSPAATSLLHSQDSGGSGGCFVDALVQARR